MYQIEKKAAHEPGLVEVYQVEAPCLSDALIAVELGETPPVDHFSDFDDNRLKYKAFVIGGF